MRDGEKRALRYRWYIFLLFAVQYLLLFFHRVCPAVLAPELTSTFNISGTALGVLASAYFYPYALMQVPVGMLSDSWGARKTATLFGSVGGIGVILFGLSPSFGLSVFARILIGLGVSAVFVPGMKVFAGWFRGREYGKISGFFVGSGSIGWVLGAAPLAMLVQAFDWREIMIAIGVLTIFLTVLTWFIVADTPEAKGFPALVEQRSVPTIDEGPFQGIKQIFSDRYFWSLAFWFLTRTGIIFSFFGLWAGPYLMDVYKLSPMSAGTILSIFPLAIIVGSPFLGYLSDRVLVSRKLVLIGTSVLHAGCWLFLLSSYDSLSVPALYVLFFVMGIVAGSPGNVGFSNIKEVFPVNIAGTSIGAANLFAFFGGVLLQPLIGFVLDAAGKISGAYPPSAYRTAFIFFFVISLVSLVSVLFCKETLSRDRRSTVYEREAEK
jgi:sugar phosphate permease